MKQLLLGVTTLYGAILLGGCPIYSASSDSRACGDYGCFDCPAGSSPSGGTCIPWACSSSSECPAGYTCGASSPSGGLSCIPVPTSGGSSSSGGSGRDCSGGCRTGYICKLSGGQSQCVPSPSPDGGISGDAAVFDSGPLDGSADQVADASVDVTTAFDAPDTWRFVDGSNASDGAQASDASSLLDSPSTNPCNANADCSNTARCINGICAPQDQLCADTTQCVASGAACVDGVCEPHCSPSAPCPAGYACDFTRGICNLNPHPCGSSSLPCQGGSTCVEQRCVAPCGTSDAGSACPGEQLCVHGGCIPNEAAHFTCKNDGQSGQLATTCGATEICLHHGCYAGCDIDAGLGACMDTSLSCKRVTLTAGTYDVCGTPSNLGSDCDPPAGKYCAAGVCIDGYCK
ncbi:MAG: hypothetical protein M3O46_14350 [Myxococcota bacterium]|nr:hypothetical protein [Myxococcota bacterium]